jgi:hypothetical protein
MFSFIATKSEWIESQQTVIKKEVGGAEERPQQRTTTKGPQQRTTTKGPQQRTTTRTTTTTTYHKWHIALVHEIVRFDCFFLGIQIDDALVPHKFDNTRLPAQYH